MKKQLFFFTLILFAFLSCKKDSPKSSTPPIITNNISATIDGVSETFNITAKATVVDSLTHSITILGFHQNSAGQQDEFIIMVTSNSPIATGTYSVSTVLNSNYTSVPFLLYGDVESGVNYATNYSGFATTITITAINSTNVQGTFSGELLDESNNDLTTKNITNGTFNVNITSNK